MPSSKKSSASTRTASKAPKPTKVVAQPPFDLAPDRPPDWFGWLLLALVLLTVIGLACVVWAADITLSWQANTEADLAGYKLYQSTTSGQYAAPVVTVGPVTTQKLTIPSPQVDTTYYFTLSAYDLAGNESGKSSEVSKLVAGVPAPSAPGMPVLTVVAVTSTELDIRWPTVSDGVGGVAKVDIRLGSLTDHWGLMTTQSCPASPCRLTGLTSGTTYQVQAVAYRTEATRNVFGPLSAPVSLALTAPDLPPAPPQGLTIASATPDKVVILASAKDCRRVLTTVAGTTTTQQKRTITCVR